MIGLPRADVLRRPRAGHKRHHHRHEDDERRDEQASAGHGQSPPSVRSGAARCGGFLHSRWRRNGEATRPPIREAATAQTVQDLGRDSVGARLFEGEADALSGMT
jgi:hypothetical protein